MQRLCLKVCAGCSYFVVNALVQGEEVLRKNGCIVNTGGKISREDLKQRVRENKRDHEVSDEQWMNIVLPRPANKLDVVSNVKETVGMWMGLMVLSGEG
jgi:hypothetical protein